MATRTDPTTLRFIPTVLRNQPSGLYREQPNNDLPEGEHNWRHIELDIHTRAIPSHFSGYFRCGALLEPKTGHWKSDEKPRSEAPRCPGAIDPEELAIT